MSIARLIDQDTILTSYSAGKSPRVRQEDEQGSFWPLSTTWVCRIPYGSGGTLVETTCVVLILRTGEPQTVAMRVKIDLSISRYKG
jgi:hypothetical protein